VTLGGKEPQLVSKTLVEFAKGRDNVELRGMILDGKAFEGNFIKELAKLPSRKELLTAVAIRMKSPITALVMTLNGLLQSFVVVLNEIQKKKAQEA
jgi:large subunit ribosomal protein L10